MKNSIAFSIIFLAVNTLNACSWCSVATHEPRSLAAEYIAQYFPKSNGAINHYFSTMCPRGLAQGLKDMVEKTLAQKTWFYFSNTQQRFVEGEYWERIILQCELLAKFIERASVRIVDTTVSDAISYYDILNSNGRYVRLLDYWKAYKITNHYYFYAFYFDQVNNMFLEGIKQLDQKQIKEKHGALKKVFKQLKGSLFEKQYEAALHRADELAQLVQQKLKLTSKKKS